MNIPAPNFVPVPGGEAMELISIVSLVVGICLTAAGGLFLFLNRRKGEKKNTLPWLLLCVGVLLMINHGVQLMFGR